ncbi:TfoX/Sxy family protein [Algoriphagus aquimarinus]|uniref:TfoX N-terminal domain-containing protein n=1 Tax=Algoriphagus aquimarinus TaxID=237018 RepID=A0A1I0VK65_9BACT|nr:TfoX/Sxy family protein [Algoriphagus aquimarinus]SFA76588.1 TfoX N-terminal domain-containing protein [Algoriphagus aquimarinus]|tara:strand:+ start:328959 stop:329315 length:357 start_codon:yes stop_codon:yes gene_type:complete
MAFDEYLAERLASSFKRRGVAFTAKKMMGGMLFMVDDKMCIGLNRDKTSGEDRMMVRVGEFAQDMCMKRAGCRTMEFTGRPMKGFVYVDPEGFDMDEDWEFWIEKALEYNPLAKRSKK